MKTKTLNLWFGIEWSTAYYLALDCKIRKDGKHYSKQVYEVMWDITRKKKVYSVKSFNMEKRSIEDYSYMSGTWPAKEKEIKMVLANTYQIS